MNGEVALPETLDFKLSVRSKDYLLWRSALLEKIKDASPESLPQDVLKDENLTSLQQLWESKDQSDVDLVVDNTVIHAHKCILVAASEYFRAMFSGDFAEAGRKEIELRDITTTGLEHVLGAIYNGTVVVTETNVLNTLDTADKLQLQAIIDSCEDFLICGIDAANCFQLLQLSEKYTLPKLNRQIETFIISNFQAASQHSLYPDIQSDALVTFISNDELDYPEIDIFNATMKWFKVKSSEEKLAAMCDVMKHIRFTYMTSQQIKELVFSEPLIAKNPVCKEMIQNAMAYVIKYEEDTYSRPIMEASNPEKPRGKQSVAVILPEPEQEQQLRQPALPQLFFFGFTNEGGINMADINVFESQAEFAVFSMNVMQMGNSLFFLGAKQLDEQRKDAKMVLLRYNVQSGEWVTLCEPPFNPLVVNVSIIHNNNIYVFGGATYMNTRWIPINTFQSGCYKYSIANNEWTDIAHYPHSVAHPAACVLEDEIYIVGGGGPTVDTRERDLVNAYNVTTNEWTSKCVLNHGRSGHRVCCIGGKIYAIGGRNPFKKDVPECEVYDPEENQWTLLSSAPVPQPVASFNLLVYGDNIIILGGGDESDEHKTTIQTFNTSTLTWSLYNWKDDQPHFIPMGSIHNLPLVRARMSCFTRSEYTPHEPVVPDPPEAHLSDYYFSDSEDEIEAGDDVNDNNDDVGDDIADDQGIGVGGMDDDDDD